MKFYNVDSSPLAETEANPNNHSFSIYKSREGDIWKELDQQASQDDTGKSSKKQLILELANIYEWYADNGFYVHPKSTICSEIMRTLKRKEINIDRTWVWEVLDPRFRNNIEELSSRQTVGPQQINDKNLLYDNKIVYENKLQTIQESRQEIEYLTNSQIKELYYEDNTSNYELAKIAVERGIPITITPDLKNLIFLLKEQAKKRKENKETNDDIKNSQQTDNEQIEEDDTDYDDLLEQVIRADRPYDEPIENVFADTIELSGKLDLITADYARKYPPSKEFIAKHLPLIAVKNYMRMPGTDMKSKRSFARWIELADMYDDHGKHGSSSLDKAIGMYKDAFTNELVRVERSLTREHLGEKIPKIKDIRKLLYEVLPYEFSLIKWYEGDPDTKHDLSMQRFAVGHSVKLSPKLSDRSIGSH